MDVPMLYTPPPRDPKAPPVRVNLLSDTQTRPTPAMREAMARAEVGAEQTANIGGGTIWKKAALDEVTEIAKSAGLATHMDGARLLNACVATGIPARDMAKGWDSAWIDFSKGLGAPIGGAIAGTAAF